MSIKIRKTVSENSRYFEYLESEKAFHKQENKISIRHFFIYLVIIFCLSISLFEIVKDKQFDGFQGQIIIISAALIIALVMSFIFGVLLPSKNRKELSKKAEIKKRDAEGILKSEKLVLLQEIKHQFIDLNNPVVASLLEQLPENISLELEKPKE